jgi:hypothetical protein
MTNTEENTVTELNPAGVEAAAEEIFTTDQVMMGPLDVLLPAGYPTTWADVPEGSTMKSEYREQAQKVVSAYFAGER